MGYQSEAQLEIHLIKKLGTLNYDYVILEEIEKKISLKLIFF